MQDKLIDKASALQNMAYAMGACIGPILGGKLTDVVGFRTTADIMAVMTLGYAIINFFVVFVLCKTKNTAAASLE